MLIKILRLGRVCRHGILPQRASEVIEVVELLRHFSRLIRVMRFGAVRELRVIILGVLSGSE